MSSTGQVTSSTANTKLITVALENYTKITGIKLSENSYAATLEQSNSPEAIIQLLQRQERAFKEYRDGNHRLIGYLSPVVKVYQAFSGVLGGAVGLVPFKPANALLVGINVLLAAASGVTSSYDALLELFERLENFLKRLELYTTTPPTPIMTDLIIKVMTELLLVLALATKQINQGRIKKFTKKLLGESEIEAVLKRLDRLTQEEVLIAVAQISGVVHGLEGNIRTNVEASSDSVRQELVAIRQLLEMNETTRNQLPRDIQRQRSPLDPGPSTNSNFIVHGVEGNMRADAEVPSDSIRQELVAIRQVLDEMNEMRRNQLPQDIEHRRSPPDLGPSTNPTPDVHGVDNIRADAETPLDNIRQELVALRQVLDEMNETRHNQLPRDIQRQRSNPPPDSGSSTDPNFIQGAPVLPWPQSGMPVRYDTSQALQQPHVGPNFGSEYDPVHLVEPNVGYVYENHGFVRQQSSGPMDVAWPLGPAGVQNTLWGPYSQVAGRTMVRKRKALIIGINYVTHPDSNLKLNGPVKDAYAMADFLHANFSFAHDDVRVMTDEKPRDLPTKENILDAMRTLVYDAQPHDSLVFFFSGYALQVKDLTGFETTGLASGICALDCLVDDPNPNADTRGLITNNVMHEVMVKYLPQQCRLTAIFETGHSASLLGLPHFYDSNGVVKPIVHPDKLWFLRQRESHADVVSLSASKHDQNARETMRGGALRCAFIECVGTFGDTLTYRELLRGVRDYMRRYGFPQKPQLSSSHEIDTNIRFTM